MIVLFEQIWVLEVGVIFGKTALNQRNIYSDASLRNPSRRKEMPLLEDPTQNSTKTNK